VLSSPREAGTEASGLPPDLIFEKIGRSDLHAHLLRTVSAAAVTHVLEAAREAVQRHPGLVERPKLTEGLLRALNDPGIYLVKSMAKAVGCSVRALEKDWQEVWGEHPRAPRLKDFCTGVTLVWALLEWLWDPDTSWWKIAHRVGVGGRTLREYFRHWIGKTPAEVDVRDAPAIIIGLEKKVFGFLRS